MKKILFTIISALLISVLALSAFAAPAVSVKLNGQTLDFEQPPVIIEGRTLVPLRAIFEALGAFVEWDGATKTVTSVKDDVTIKLTIGSNVLYRNGTGTELDVPAQIVGEGYTMVPARAIAEAYGVIVGWDDATKTVLLTTAEQGKQENANPYESLKGVVFDFESGNDGWKGYEKASPSTVENGHLKVTSVEGVNDPQIAKSGLTIDTAKYGKVVVRFKYDNYGKEDKTCSLYFASDVTGSFNEAKNTKAYYNECYVDEEGYTWAEFAVFRNENWKGTCTSLRFDPASDGNGEYLIDKIILKAAEGGNSSVTETVTPSVTPSVTPAAPAIKISTLEDCKNAGGIVFEFESDNEGWKEHAKMLTAEVTGGTLKLVSLPDAKDPQLLKSGLAVSTDACKTILIKYKWTGTGNTFSELFFTTDSDTALSETKKLKGYLDSYIKDTDGYSWAVFDMSTNESWKGTCKSVRFDPIGSGNGEFIIDKIVFVMAEQQQQDISDKKRLMLVGDSIAFEYGPHLMSMISDEYVMYEKEGREIAAQNLDVAVGGNAGDSKNVVKFVKQMDSEGRFNFDLFLFNCGLHDIKRNKPDRKLQVSITDYEANLREVLAICKKNNVPVVFVDITPIIDTRYGDESEFTRKNEDVIAYNEVALKVMKENDVPVIGLYDYTLSLGQLSTTMRDHAHYYTDIQQKQARYIADFILSK